QQRNLPRMIELVLHHTMQHVVEGVVSSPLTRNHLVKPRIRESSNGRNQFLVDAPHLGHRRAPCRLSGIFDRRKILRSGKRPGDPAHTPQHSAIPRCNMQYQLPDRMARLDRTRRRLRRRDALQNLKHGIAMPSLAIKRAPKLIGNAGCFRHKLVSFVILSALGGDRFTECASHHSAHTAIPASSAARVVASPSSSRHRPASTARQLAPARAIVSIVFTPITGTSKRISCFGFATFTTVSARLSVEAPPFDPDPASDSDFKSNDRISSPARSIVASVPSIASTVTHAASAITTVCPMSYSASRRPTARPYSMFLRSCPLGARLLSTPVFASSGSSSAVEFSSMMPSSASTFATAPRSESVFRVPSESSSFASRQSGLMAEKICLCLTCPAMTARVTPSALKVSMSLDSSPSESQ